MYYHYIKIIIDFQAYNEYRMSSLTDGAKMQNNSDKSNSLEALAIAASIVDVMTCPNISERAVKPKRKRASQFQLAVLRQHYSQDQFPSTQCRQQLAIKLGMTSRSVQIWFQNQRQHDKMKSMASKIMETSIDANKGESSVNF